MKIQNRPLRYDRETVLLLNFKKCHDTLATSFVKNYQSSLVDDCCIFFTCNADG